MKKQYVYAVDGHYPPEVQQMMATTDKCLNCGKKLSYLQRKEGRRNRGYCSAFCYCAKPPKMAYIEKDYGKPIREVIVEMLNKGASVIAVADQLGIGKANFYKWMKKLKIKRKWY